MLSKGKTEKTQTTIRLSRTIFTYIFLSSPFFSSPKEPKISQLWFYNFFLPENNIQPKTKKPERRKNSQSFTSSETTKLPSNYHVSVAFCVEPRFLPFSPSHPHSLNSLLLLVSSFPQLPPIFYTPILNFLV